MFRRFKSRLASGVAGSHARLPTEASTRKARLPALWHWRHRGALAMVRIGLLVCLPLQATAATSGLRVGAEVDFPPYSEADSDGHPTGFAVELLRAVLRTNGTEATFEAGSWDQVWDGLREGRYDILPLVARMPGRDQQVELTSPHTVGYDSFFVRRGGPDIDSIKAARGLKLIVMRSDAAHDFLAARGFDRLTLVDSLVEGLRLLATGQHDALLAPQLQGDLLLYRLGLGQVIRKGPQIAAYRREFSFAVRKGELATRDLLERGLAQVRASGEYDRLYRKWLDIGETVWFPYSYLVVAVLALILLASLAALWTWTLGRQVAKRSRELERAHDEIEAHRARLQEVLHRLPVFVRLLTPQHRVAFANRLYEQRYGPTEHQHCHRPDAADDRSDDCHVDRVLASGLPAAWDWQGADGREYEVQGFPFADVDGAPMVMEVGIDVTETRRAQQALREANRSLERRVADRTAELLDSEARYRTLFESMAEGFALHEVVLDEAGRPWDCVFLDVNPAFESLTGLKREQLLGRRMLEVLPEIEHSWIETYAEVALSGEPSRFEHYIDAHDRWYEVFAYRPQPGRFAVLFSDITERKHAAEALRDEGRRKDEFLAMLAHELRNPLAPIRNAAQILGMMELPDPALQRVRGILDRQVNHLTRLVDELLDISRIVRGRIELKREFVTLSEWVEQALEGAGPLIEQRQQQLQVHLPPQPVWLEGDPVRLVQSLLNLLNNAANYTREGGCIALDACTQDGQLKLEVRDNGAGLAPDVLPRVFDLFQQGERSLDRSQGGLGIGLAVVRRLIELHGGRVEAESPGEGLGSTFRIWLPLPQQVPAVAESAPAPSRGSAVEILVVDDDIPVAESTAMLLQLEGHQVDWVDSGEKALQRIAADPPAVVLLDIGMPHMDGFETARRIRALPGAHRIRLAALTGYGDQQTRERVLEAGFDRHLVKPVALESLRALLNEAVEQTA